MCCRFIFCFFSVILKLCLAQDWNSIQPELSTLPVLGQQQEDLNQPGTTIAGGGFLVDNSQPGLPTFFNDNPSVNNNEPDTTGFGSLLTSNDPLSVHDGNAVAFASNSPQTFNSGNHQQQIGESDFSSTTASAADGSEAGRVLDSPNLAQLDQTNQRDPQLDLALIGDDSPVPSVPLLDILNNAIQGNPSTNDPERRIEPIHDPEERLTKPEKPDCEDGKFAFCCNQGYPDGPTMKGVPLAQRVHKRRLCTRWGEKWEGCHWRQNTFCCVCKVPRMEPTAFGCTNPFYSKDPYYEDYGSPERAPPAPKQLPKSAPSVDKRDQPPPPQVEQQQQQQQQPKPNNKNQKRETPPAGRRPGRPRQPPSTPKEPQTPKYRGSTDTLYPQGPKYPETCQDWQMEYYRNGGTGIPDPPSQ